MTPDPRSDRELLAAHAAGEPHAFDEVVRRHADRLWALTLRTLNDQEDAADAVQETFLSAFRSAGEYRGESGVTTWLHRIALNACLDRIRRRRARPTDTLGEQDVPIPRDPIAEHVVRLDVADALAALPVAQRLAVVLVDMQGFTVAEAAEILGTREGTVKSRCARGRLRLAELLGHARPAPDEPAEPLGERAAGSPRAGNARRAPGVEEEGGSARRGRRGRRR